MPFDSISTVSERDILIFSPIFPTCSVLLFSRSVLGSDSKVSATSLENFMKSSFLATKSVSQFTSTRIPFFRSALTALEIIPSPASRPAFFAAEATPFLRRIEIASSKSPLVSANARLQSIRPAPVFSRKSITASFVIFDISIFCLGELFLIRVRSRFFSLGRRFLCYSCRFFGNLSHFSLRFSRFFSLLFTIIKVILVITFG